MNTLSNISMNTLLRLELDLVEEIEHKEDIRHSTLDQHLTTVNLSDEDENEGILLNVE